MTNWHLVTTGRKGLKCQKTNPMTARVLRRKDSTSPVLNRDEQDDAYSAVSLSINGVVQRGSEEEEGPLRAVLKPALIAGRQPYAFPVRMAYVEIAIVKDSVAANTQDAYIRVGIIPEKHTPFCNTNCILKEDKVETLDVGNALLDFNGDILDPVFGQPCHTGYNSASDAEAATLRHLCFWLSHPSTSGSASQQRAALSQSVLFDCKQGCVLVDGIVCSLMRFDGARKGERTSVVEGDILGVGVVPDTQAVFFCRNGELLGIQLAGWLSQQLANACIDLTPEAAGQIVRFNVGTTPFAAPHELLQRAAQLSKVCQMSQQRRCLVISLWTVWAFISLQKAFLRKAGHTLVCQLRTKTQAAILKGWFWYISFTRTASSQLIDKDQINCLHRAINMWIHYVEIRKTKNYLMNTFRSRRKSNP